MPPCSVRSIPPLLQISRARPVTAAAAESDVLRANQAPSSCAPGNSLLVWGISMGWKVRRWHATCAPWGGGAESTDVARPAAHPFQTGSDADGRLAQQPQSLLVEAARLGGPALTFLRPFVARYRARRHDIVTGGRARDGSARRTSSPDGGTRMVVQARLVQLEQL